MLCFSYFLSARCSGRSSCTARPAGQGWIAFRLESLQAESGVQCFTSWYRWCCRAERFKVNIRPVLAPDSNLQIKAVRRCEAEWVSGGKLYVRQAACYEAMLFRYAANDQMQVEAKLNGVLIPEGEDVALPFVMMGFKNLPMIELKYRYGRRHMQSTNSYGGVWSTATSGIIVKWICQSKP